MSYESSIQVCSEVTLMEIGDNVSFIWNFDNRKYQGEIVQIMDDRLILKVDEINKNLLEVSKSKLV